MRFLKFWAQNSIHKCICMVFAIVGACYMEAIRSKSSCLGFGSPTPSYSMSATFLGQKYCDQEILLNKKQPLNTNSLKRLLTFLLRCLTWNETELFIFRVSLKYKKKILPFTKCQRNPRDNLFTGCITFF